MRIYLAGPLFTSAERIFNAQLAAALRDLGHDVLLPQETVPVSPTPEAIFAMCVDGIDGADVVVANMDGPDPDSGTCWECGYAYGRKPVVLFRTDFRRIYELPSDAAGGAPAPYNLMLAASAAARIEAEKAGVDTLAKLIDEKLGELDL